MCLRAKQAFRERITNELNKIMGIVGINNNSQKEVISKLKLD